MTRTICAITGSTGGIGISLARIAAEQGHDLVLHGRSEAKLEPLRQQLLEEFKDLSITLVTGDLGTARGAQEVAEAIARAAPKLDLLINNAGVLMEGVNTSPDGLDMHVQVNLIAPYVLMTMLKPNLSPAKGTVINVASGAVLRAKAISAAALKQPDTSKKLFGAYAQSKLAMAIATRALAASFASADVFVVSADPGPTKTDLTSGDGMPGVLKLLRPFLYASADQGARNIFAGADRAARDHRPGAYMTKGREKDLQDFAKTPDIAKEILDFCAAQAGLPTPAIQS
jgi:NAD(P)-dependent dehydrogenase (short-subunit alcohol dehydrogenase family)